MHDLSSTPQSGAGLYGKLPAHGDFLSRNLSPEFVQGWDDWLQRSVASSQEQLGGRWLDLYLTSPLWRFALSPGVIDSNVWVGVMMPSVDKVGRYFPLTLAVPYPQSTSPVELMVSGESVFRELEQIALSGLDEHGSVESVNQALESIPPIQLSGIATKSVALDFSRPIALQMEKAEQNPLLSHPFLLDCFLQQRLPSYSLWWSTGSEYVTPSFLVSGHLPPAQMFVAMLDGQWQQWSWNSPFGVIPQNEQLIPVPDSAGDDESTVINEEQMND
ncbi:type VI secretion-associated protein [Gammaproteobacteria bacterium 45_16_T64]|nr:type VI secretion-associated protein [Gammaproteobacteria bacterium 45_16_T64]